MPAPTLVLGGVFAQMIYKAYASVYFDTAAARTAAASSIDSALAARPSATSAKTTRVDPARGRLLRYEIEGGAVDVNALYTAIVSAANANGVTSGVAHWHACYHGDNANLCAVTGRTDW